MASAFLILAVVVALALVFDYVNGFHDAANAVATVVSTGVLPPRTAVLLAAACDFIGAFLGVGVAKMIGGNIADPASVTQTVVALALVFDYVNGFHDAANAVATVVSTGVLPPRTAVLLAAACDFIGAFLGVGVAKMIGGNIADPASVTQTVVAAALVGAICWN